MYNNKTSNIITISCFSSTGEEGKECVNPKLREDYEYLELGRDL